MRVSHEEYMRRLLGAKKIEYENLEIEHRIAIAVYNARKDMITKQIHSIERQLEDGADANE